MAEKRPAGGADNAETPLDTMTTEPSEKQVSAELTKEAIESAVDETLEGEPGNEHGSSESSASSRADGEMDESWEQALSEEPWDSVVACYDSEVRALGTEKDAAPLWYELGLVYEERLGRARPAAMCFQNAFNIDPSWRPNIHAARRLFASVGNWAMVAKLLEDEANATEAAADKADLLLERATLLLERLDQKDEASRTLATGEALAPGRLHFLAHQANLAAECGEHERLAELTLLMAAAAESAKIKVALLTLAGGLLAGPASSPDRAVEVYREAVTLDSKQSEALSALLHLLEKNGKYEELLELYKMQARESESPREALSAWMNAARLAAERLRSREDAIGFLQEARQISPQDPTVLSELAKHYEVTGDIEQLVTILDSLAAITEDPRARGAIHMRVGGLLDELDRKDEAVAAYRRSLEMTPGEPAVLAALGKLYFRAGQWEDLIWTFEQEMAVTSDARQRASRGFKIAEVQEQRLDLPEAAISTLRRVLEETPGYLPAVHALTRLYESTGRWSDMVALLEQEATETEDISQKLALLERIASVREERMADSGGAAETWERALSLVPTHLPAIRSLARLYRKMESWQQLIWALEQEASQVEDQRQVIALLHQAAELYEERVEDKDAAIKAYRKVLGLQPNYLPALKAVGRLCEQTARWEELVEMFRMELEVTRSSDHQVSLLMKMGDIFERRLSNEEEAIQTYREILSERPDSIVAMRALERLYRAREDWSPLVEVLEQQARVFEGPLGKALLLTRAASILESRCDDQEAALESYKAALEALPGHGPALRAVVRLHTRRGAWRDLADVLEAMAQEGDPSSTVNERRHLGLVYMNHLDQPEAALSCFERVLEIVAGDPVSLAASDVVLSRLGRREAAAQARASLAEQADSKTSAVALLRAAALSTELRCSSGQAADALWERLYELAPEEPIIARRIEAVVRRSRTPERLADIYRRQLDHTQDSDLRLSLAMRLGEFSMEHGEPALAETAYRTALEVSPAHIPAIRGLKKVLAEGGRWSEVQDLLELEGEVSRDPDRAINILIEAAALREEQIEDLDGAERNYKKVLERNPVEPRAYARLTALLQSRGRYEDLVALHRSVAEAAADPSIRADAYFAAAQLYEGQLDRKAEGLSALESALLDAPRKVEALELGSELAVELEEWEKAGKLSESRVELGGDSNVLMSHLLRLAWLHHEKLESLERALAWAQDAISVGPGNREALRRLSDIHITMENWAGAAVALGQLSEAETDTTKRVSILLELAEVQASRRQDAAAAISTLEYARTLEPANVRVVTALGALYEANEDWTAIARSYEAVVGASSDKASLYPLILRLGEVKAGHLEDPGGAISSYQLAIEVSPDELGPRIALANLLSRQDGSRVHAIGANREVLTRDPLHLPSYHSLFRLFLETDDKDRAWVVSSILAFFGDANDEESAFSSDYKARASKTPEGTLTPEEISSLLRHSDDSGPLGDIMAVVGNLLSRAFPSDLARWKVGRSERLGPRDSAPLRRITEALSENLGGFAFELYRSTAIPDALAAFAADPPILVVGSDVIRRRPVVEQRFELSRALAAMCFGTTLVLELEVDDLARAIQGAVRAVIPEFTALSPRQDPELTKACSKSMGRRGRKALEEPAKVLARATGQVDMNAFKIGARRTTERAGLLLSADVASGLSLLAAEAGVDTTSGPASALRGAAAIEESLRFLLGDAFFELRRRLGLSL